MKQVSYPGKQSQLKINIFAFQAVWVKNETDFWEEPIPLSAYGKSQRAMDWNGGQADLCVAICFNLSVKMTQIKEKLTNELKLFCTTY